MFGVCFYYTDFDRDVSSGTPFALQQWSELLGAFNIDEVAVINQTEEELPFPNYPSLSDFLLDQTGKEITLTRAQGSHHYKEFNYTKTDWLVFGSSERWNMEGGIYIDTYQRKELYPREAAAIILAEASWHIH